MGVVIYISYCDGAKGKGRLMNTLIIKYRTICTDRWTMLWTRMNHAMDVNALQLTIVAQEAYVWLLMVVSVFCFVFKDGLAIILSYSYNYGLIYKTKIHISAQLLLLSLMNVINTFECVITVELEIVFFEHVFFKDKSFIVHL